MTLGNQAADTEAKAGMSAHQIDWEEYKHVDDRTYLAMVVQLLIKEIWERREARKWEEHELLPEVSP